MNRQEHMLDILSEECIEVAKEVSKALRFTLDEQYVKSEFTNRERIVNELKDVLCMIEICRTEGLLPPICITEDDIETKFAKIERYMQISRQYGALT